MPFSFFTPLKINRLFAGDGRGALSGLYRLHAKRLNPCFMHFSVLPWPTMKAIESKSAPGTTQAKTGIVAPSSRRRSTIMTSIAVSLCALFQGVSDTVIYDITIARLSLLARFRMRQFTIMIPAHGCEIGRDLALQSHVLPQSRGYRRGSAAFNRLRGHRNNTPGRSNLKHLGPGLKVKMHLRCNAFQTLEHGRLNSL